MTVCDGYFEVSRDWARKVDNLGLVDEGYEFLIVGYERGDYGASMFGASFMTLCGARTLGAALQLVLRCREVDESFDMDFYYEIWSLVDGAPDWQLACCEWCELVSEEGSEALFHVHVANSGCHFIPAFVYGHDLWLPKYRLSSQYELAWRCRDVRDDPRGVLTDWRCCGWLSPDVCEAIYSLVSVHPAYVRCGEVEDSINAEFDNWLEMLATTVY